MFFVKLPQVNGAVDRPSRFDFHDDDYVFTVGADSNDTGPHLDWHLARYSRANLNSSPRLRK